MSMERTNKFGVNGNLSLSESGQYKIAVIVA